MFLKYFFPLSIPAGFLLSIFSLVVCEFSFLQENLCLENLKL